MTQRRQDDWLPALTGALLLGRAGCGDRATSTTTSPRPPSPIVDQRVGHAEAASPPRRERRRRADHAGRREPHVGEQRVTLESADGRARAAPGRRSHAGRSSRAARRRSRPTSSRGRYTRARRGRRDRPRDARRSGPPRESGAERRRPPVARLSERSPAATPGGARRRPCDAPHTGNDCALEILSHVEAITPATSARGTVCPQPPRRAAAHALAAGHEGLERRVHRAARGARPLDHPDQDARRRQRLRRASCPSRSCPSASACRCPSASRTVEALLQPRLARAPRGRARPPRQARSASPTTAATSSPASTACASHGLEHFAESLDPERRALLSAALLAVTDLTPRTT